MDVLCEGPSGWKKGEDSVVAGAPATVTLGPILGAAMQRTGSSRAHPDQMPPLQLTGRTTADQIVVFDGPATLEGQIVKVRVDAAHGLTIFASLAPSQSAQITAPDPAAHEECLAGAVPVKS